MKYLLNISVLLLLTVINTFSQAVFKNGFIIKNNNDTVFGLIEFKGNKANSKSCIFKQNIESERQEYTPGDIKAYRFDDSKYYVSKVVTIADKEELLFLEYLINGRVDVYYYFDGQTERYFIDGGDNQLVELKEGSPKIITTYRKRLILPSKQYMGVLKYIFRESPTISKQAETVPLNRKSLIDIAHAYHNEVCANEECIIYEKKTPNDNLKFGIIGGVSFVSVSVSKDIPFENIFMRGSEFDQSISPSAGFFVKTSLPSITPHLFLQYQASLGKLSLRGRSAYEDEINVDQTYFGNKLTFKYDFIEDQKVHVNLQAGGFFNYAIFSGSFLSNEYAYMMGVHANYLSEYDYGPVAGIGLLFDTPAKQGILLDFQYQLGLGLWKYFKVHYFSINLGYQF
jgi:hypothetical protein